MKVVDNRKIGKKVRFEDLDVGDAYLDEDNNICIKTADDYENTNCMYYREVCGDWIPECEYNYTEVMPIKVTLTVEG